MSEELSIDSTGETSGELPRKDKAKSSLNTSGFESLDSEGLCDRDGRGTEDSRDGGCRSAMMKIVGYAVNGPQGLVGSNGRAAESIGA